MQLNQSKGKAAGQTKSDSKNVMLPNSVHAATNSVHVYVNCVYTTSKQCS